MTTDLLSTIAKVPRYLWNPQNEPNLKKGNDSWVHGKLFAWEIWHNSLPLRTATHSLIMKELARDIREGYTDYDDDRDAVCLKGDNGSNQPYRV